MKDLEEIIKNCCMVSGVDITSKNRKRDTFVYGRACYYLIAKKLKEYRYIQKVGKEVSVQKYTDSFISEYLGWNHASGINARQKIDYDYFKDKIFVEMLDKVNELCGYMTEDKSDEPRYTESQVQKLRDQITELLKKNRDNERLIDGFTNSTNGFLLEINQLPEEQRNEFRDFKWRPHKRMLESRIKN